MTMDADIRRCAAVIIQWRGHRLTGCGREFGRRRAGIQIITADEGVDARS
jgi:hypothetical protein